MAKKKEQKQEPVLTEWQKRNLEFLRKKEAERLEQEKLNAQFIAEKRAQLEEAKQGGAGKEEKSDSESSSQDPKVSTEDANSKTEGKSPKVIPPKEKKSKPKKKRMLTNKQLAQAVSSVLVAIITLALALFFVAPYSKQKNLTVSGNKNASRLELLDQTGIKATDYITTVFWHQQSYAKKVANENQWVKQAQMTYAFPNRFTLKVKEYRVIAYSQTDKGFIPILENGKRLETVNATQLPETYLIINLTNETDIQSLIKQLSQLDKKIVQDIRAISLAKSESTKDLLNIEMKDGTLVRVPLSELKTKMPYYPKVKATLNGPYIIDMEVGIYSSTSDIEAQIAEKRTKVEETTSETTTTDQAHSQNQNVTEAEISQVSQ